MASEKMSNNKEDVHITGRKRVKNLVISQSSNGMDRNEKDRLTDNDWKKWGPYLSERQWGTVREDYSADGEAWTYTNHDMARSMAWRWGEEGIGGLSDKNQLLCFSLALWNKSDPILKERLFGLSGYEGNHGEDVKELYYYLDSSPTHSYMKMLYKYPQAAYPYEWLVFENRRRTKADPEFELLDTGIFDGDKYFDVFIEYAKADKDDVLIKFTVHNRGDKDAAINILPTLWFRNTWSWGQDDYKPKMRSIGDGKITIQHKDLGEYMLHSEGEHRANVFCDNETNVKRFYGLNEPGYFKDGVNEYIVGGNENAVNFQQGTKVALNYDISVPSRGAVTIRLRLESHRNPLPFEDFDTIFLARQKETDQFYNDLQQDVESADGKLVQRQAFAGMLWNKQFYYYNVYEWLKGAPIQTSSALVRYKGRNHRWKHLKNSHIISMPDKWEFPWYASWDLAFHCVSLALIDSKFAKQQLLLLTHDWYMHPSGKLPAYEWSFDDTNPPVHAWAAYRVYEIDKKNSGKGDLTFLKRIFHKLLLNFTWWVNRKDTEGKNIFEGGFLGMDNIGLFDRNNPILPADSRLEQADGTSWMAMYSLNLMRIALELSLTQPEYQDMANKFFEHFLNIAASMASMGGQTDGLWDNDDEFYYDNVRMPGDTSFKLKIRSMVGLIPLFAVEVIDHSMLQKLPEFAKRLNWLLEHRPDLASLVSRWYEKGNEGKHLLSLLRGHRIKRILHRMLDETEFLSNYGIRALSKHYEENPYEIRVEGQALSVQYAPGESTTALFGGNSNWRGPVWMPMNFLIIESLQRFYHYYGDDFKVEYPSESGNYLNLYEISSKISKRLTDLFLRDDSGNRAVFGTSEKLQRDPYFKDHLLFYEYFHGDSGKGLGASHQTGWTGLIANILLPEQQHETILKSSPDV